MVEYKGNEVVFQSYLTQSAGEVIVTLHWFHFFLAIWRAASLYSHAAD
jgi:hypothetical protein